MNNEAAQKLQTAGGAEREARELAHEFLGDLIGEYDPEQPYWITCKNALAKLLETFAARCANEARQQMAMIAADECDGGQIERPSKTLNAQEFNHWICSVGDKIRALGGVSEDWWDKSMAQERARAANEARLEEQTNYPAPHRHSASLQQDYDRLVADCPRCRRIAELKRAVAGDDAAPVGEKRHGEAELRKAVKLK